MKKTLCLLLAVATLGLTACGKKTTVQEKQDTLVVGTANFDGKFSPFFYTNAYEGEVLDLIHLPLLGTDREGAVVMSGIKGETRPYNGTDYTYTGIADCTVTENPDGTVHYDITLKEGIKFSDGVTIDIDDVIFSLYVTLDPSYDGTMTAYSLPIVGLETYRKGETDFISGIQRKGDYSLRVVMENLSATAIHTLAEIPVAPLHYYGQEENYDFNAHKFGFILRYPENKVDVTGYSYESWHYRFVGIDAATDIYNGGITLEEYLGK